MTNRILLEVDSTKLFDALRAMNGDCAPLGERLASLLLDPGEASGILARIALSGVYGIDASVVSAPTNEDEATLRATEIIIHLLHESGSLPDGYPSVQDKARIQTTIINCTREVNARD